MSIIPFAETYIQLYQFTIVQFYTIVKVSVHVLSYNLLVNPAYSNTIHIDNYTRSQNITLKKIISQKEFPKTFLIHFRTRISMSNGIPSIPFHQSSWRNRSSLLRCHWGHYWTGIGNRACNAINNTSEYDASIIYK